MRARLLTLLIAAPLVACGSKTSEPARPADDAAVADTSVTTGDTAVPPSDGPTTLPAGTDDACRNYWKTICSTYFKCLPWASSIWKDEADCAAIGHAGCIDSLTEPGAVVDLAKFTKCQSAVSTALSTCEGLQKHFGNTGRPIPECADFKGTLPSDAPCIQSGQCATGFCRYDREFDACGKCGNPILEGGACNVTKSFQCANGTVCLGAKCKVPGEAGAVCDTTTPCASDLRCIEGKCAAPPAPGSACDPLGSYYTCAFGHYCNRVKNVCTPLVTQKAGQPCGFLDSGDLSNCEYGSKCNITDKAQYKGTCVPAKKVGEACTFNDPFESECISPAICIDKVCTIRDTARCK